MILLLPALAVGFGFGLLTGGSLTQLAEVRLRAYGLLLALSLLSISLTAGVTSGQLVSDRVLVYAVWIPATALSALVLFANWRLPWSWLAAAGLLLNLVVVLLNAGMPVLISNAAISQQAEARTAVADSWLHVDADGESEGLVLADVIPVPGGSGLVSLGDLVLAIGAGATLMSATHGDYVHLLVRNR